MEVQGLGDSIGKAKESEALGMAIGEWIGKNKVVQDVMQEFGSGPEARAVE